MGENTKIEWCDHTLAKEADMLERKAIPKKFRRLYSATTHPLKHIAVVLGRITRAARWNYIAWRRAATLADWVNVVPCVGGRVTVSTLVIEQKKEKLFRLIRHSFHFATSHISVVFQLVTKLWVRCVSLSPKPVDALTALTAFQHRDISHPLTTHRTPMQSSKRFFLTLNSKWRLIVAATAISTFVGVATSASRVLTEKPKRTPLFTFHAMAKAVINNMVLLYAQP